MRPLTLLLLSGGGHTGTNVMASLAPRRKGLRVVVTSDVADEPALFNFDAAYLAPKIVDDAAAFERRVLEIIARENPDLVVPCRDEDVEWLAGLGERRGDLRAKLLCGTRDMAAIANDKWRSFEFSRIHGLPFAPSLRCDDTPDAHQRVDSFIAQHGLPLVAKPRRGVDSTGIVILAARAHAWRAMARKDHVLQQYLGRSEVLQDYLAQVADEGVPLHHTFQGIKRSLQVLIAPDGAIVHVVCTRNHITRQNARSVTIDNDPEPRRIGELCARVFSAAGWRGPLNIQCQPTSSGILLIHEFNARFTGATAARCHIGHDEIGAAVRAFTGRDLPSAFAWCKAPDVALEGLSPRAADRHDVRTLAERCEWMRKG